MPQEGHSSFYNRNVVHLCMSGLQVLQQGLVTSLGIVRQFSQGILEGHGMAPRKQE